MKDATLSRSESWGGTGPPPFVRLDVAAATAREDC